MSLLKPFACAALLATTCSLAGAQILFEDDMNDPDGTGWLTPGEDVADIDAITDFGFDYSTVGVPSAPNGVGTVGLKMEVNNDPFGGVGQENEALAVHLDDAFTGKYRFEVDIWANYALDEAGRGTTEFAGAGVGHDGFFLNFSDPANGLIDLPVGASLVFTTDGDTARDYRMYKDSSEQFIDSGQYAIEDTNNTTPALADAFPAIDVAVAAPSQNQTGTVPAGAAGFQWMTLTVDVDTEAIGSDISPDPGLATFSLTSASSGNTVEIGTIDNSNGGGAVNMEGGVALYMADVFSSVSVDPQWSFAIFDNVKVFIPNEMEQVCGDFDMDGDVDSADRTIQTTNWTGALPPGDPNATKTFAQGDCDADGDVDTADQNGTITNWTGAMNLAGNLEDGDDANLIYDRATGNVKLDAGNTASGMFISFVLGTGENNAPENLVESDPGNAGPFFDVGTNTDATTFQIGQTDPLNQGAGPVIDLGDVFPAGITSKEALAEYLTLAEYASELGSGGTFDIELVPEPTGLVLALLGLIPLLRRLPTVASR